MTNLTYKLSQYSKRMHQILLSKYYKERYAIAVGNYFLFESVEEVLTLKPFINEEVVLLDIGANIGEYSYLFNKIIGAKKVVAVEPNSGLNPSMEANLKGTDYEIINKAVTDQEGDIDFYIHSDPQMSSMEEADVSKLKKTMSWNPPEKIQKVKLEAISLKDLINNNASNDTEIFLKLDTQGNEMDVLNSGLAELSKVKYLLVEFMFDSMYKREIRFDELYKLIIDNGFETACPTNFNRRPSHVVGAVNFFFIRKD